ncbi:MAG: histidine phosphatase family protein [Caldilineaceae bacterium]|nr:histidine phosphatase family protein [Caldilineaceae bacterium]
MRLFLITHAHTQIQQAHDARQWVLSDAGQQQAALLATLPFWRELDQIVLSSEAKTRLTVAAVLAQYKLPVMVDPRFDELKRPGWTEDYAAQVQRAFAEPTQPAGEWEAASVALARFRAGITALCQQFAGATIALVGHGLTLSLYRADLLGYSQVRFADWQQLSFAAVALVDPVAGLLQQDFQAVAGHVSRA